MKCHQVDFRIEAASGKLSVVVVDVEDASNKTKQTSAVKIANKAKVLRVRLAMATCKSESVSRPNHDRVKSCITVGVAAATHLSRVRLIPVSRDILL